jgi:uncharacterized protein DUF4255/carboxypeptidase family protein
VFNDLDATLKALLDDPAAPADVRDADVSFETPDKDFRPAQPTISLFLYEIHENRTLRDPAPYVERVGDTALRRVPPVRINCTYLTTTWSPKTGALRAEEEHRMLGATLLWLNRFPVIPDDFLRGTLANPPQPYPLPAMVAQLPDERSDGQFWSALGIAPRPAFSTTVTIAMQPFDDAEELPLVQGVRVEPASLVDAALFGSVLTADLIPVGGAGVSLAGTGRSQTVGPDGRFSFDGLSFGPYELVVERSGEPDVHLQITYQADRQLHNVILTDP